MDWRIALVVIVGVGALGKTLAEIPSVGRFLSPQGDAEHAYDASRDPTVGSLFPLPTKDAYGKAIPHSGRTILVIAGGCTSCSLHAIDPRDLLPAKGETFVLAYQSSPTDLPAWMKSLPSNVRIVDDESLVLQKAANSAWQPRYLLIDDESRLARISNDDAGNPDFVRTRRSR